MGEWSLANIVDRVAAIDRSRSADPSGSRRPVVVAVAGSVAVGKSTWCAALADELRAGGSTVEVVGTDSFLLPNSELERRGIAMRKGFPESFDREALERFSRRISEGALPIDLRVYSHETYDIDGSQRRRIGTSDVAIIEGVNALGPEVAPHADVRVYLDAEPATIEARFEARFRRLTASAGGSGSSFYRQFADADPEMLASVIDFTWNEINLPNLLEHIVPTKAAADEVVDLGGDFPALGST